MAVFETHRSSIHYKPSRPQSIASKYAYWDYSQNLKMLNCEHNKYMRFVLPEQSRTMIRPLNGALSNAWTSASLTVLSCQNAMSSATALLNVPMAYDGRTSETANTAKTGVQRLCPIKIDSEIMLGMIQNVFGKSTGRFELASKSVRHFSNGRPLHTLLCKDG
ncbi:predicted protein [Aspergillus nidulans FGSC A4]|nr:predicted protein [Aspergillus nidulans FGSC A4]|eukprot:XP_660524.1 predicted protein [Aspergillus nidulans FGSC A4]